MAFNDYSSAGMALFMKYAVAEGTDRGVDVEINCIRIAESICSFAVLKMIK